MVKYLYRHHACLRPFRPERRHGTASSRSRRKGLPDWHSTGTRARRADDLIYRLGLPQDGATGDAGRTRAGPLTVAIATIVNRLIEACCQVVERVARRHAELCDLCSLCHVPCQ